MKPFQVASKLRQIAAAIDNSRNPRRELVTADLRKIIGSLRIGKFDKREFDEIKKGIENLIERVESQGWNSTAKKLSEAISTLKTDLEALQGKKAPRLRIEAGTRLGLMFSPKQPSGNLADQFNADEIYPTFRSKGVPGLFKDNVDITNQYPNAEIYFGDHPAGIDYGFVVWVEMGNDAAYYSAGTGEWY
jgi:hypothetical protein